LSGGYEVFYLLGYNVLQFFEKQPTFRCNIPPLSSGPKNNPSKKPSFGCYLLPVGFFLGLFFDPEDKGDTFPQRVK
jgi:hypothetical protein